MEIRKSPEVSPKLIRPQVPDGEPADGAKGIMPGGCFPQPRVPLDRDRLEFRRKDADKNGVLTSDEYGVGKQKQDEFRRYDRNDDGKVDLKEFKLGRFLDKLKDRKWPEGIRIKPVPMPMPKPGNGGWDIKPVPMPMPKGGNLEIKPVPMPNPKIDGSILLTGGQTISDLVSKVKLAQDAQTPSDQ